MSFTRFACWDAANAAAVLTTEAQHPAHIFAAVHYPATLYRAEGDGSGGFREVTHEDMLREFLDPLRDYVFVPITGTSGTGKSHLVRWLHLHLTPAAHQRVVFVPKAGTTLREILRGILALDGLDSEVVRTFRTRLDTTREAVLTAEEAADRLRATLATLLRHRPPVSTVGTEEAELEMWLQGVLPMVLEEQTFRSHWVGPAGPFQRLYREALGDAAPDDGRHAFTDADLPRDVRDINHVAYALRPDLGVLLSDPDTRAAALRLLNHYQAEAARELLDLQGDTLVELMKEVRRELARLRLELILLFEDFAKVQAVDRQLLETLTYTPQDQAGPFCGLRVAFACTDDYYASLALTVQTRLTFRVLFNATDVPVGQQVNLPRFTVGYLNAARVGPAALATWHAGEEATSLPNACHDCPFREPCHGTFGEAEGRGLYPLNATALAQLYERHQSGTGFNPRVLLTRILRPLLVQYREDLVGGTFPSPALHEAFGGERNPHSTLSSQASYQHDPVHHRRRLALVDIWTRVHEIQDLDPVVHEAFAVPRLNRGFPTPETSPSPGPHATPRKTPPEPPVQQPLPANPRLDELERWRRSEARMPQSLLNVLRDILVGALKARVDWGAEGLHLGKLVGGILSNNTVLNFDFQQIQVPTRDVVLVLPLDGETRDDVAVVCEGLLRFQQTQSWAFPDGHRFHRAVASALERWANELVRQVHATARGPKQVDVASAATELLVLDAMLNGRLSGSETSRADRLEAALAEPNPPQEGRSGPWTALTAALAQKRGGLRDLLLGYAHFHKNSLQTPFYDAPRLAAGTARIARTGWRPTAPLPTSPLAPFRDIQALRQRLDRDLGAAVAAERDRFVAWLDRVETLLGALPGSDVQPLDERLRDDLVRAVRAYLTRADETGTNFLDKPGSDLLKQALGTFEKSRLGLALQAARLARDTSAENTGVLLPVLCRDVMPAMQATTVLLDRLDRLIDQAERRLETEQNNLHAPGTVDIQETLDGIDRGLGHIATQLSALALESVSAP